MLRLYMHKLFQIPRFLTKLFFFKVIFHAVTTDAKCYQSEFILVSIEALLITQMLFKIIYSF